MTKKKDARESPLPDGWQAKLAKIINEKTHNAGQCPRCHKPSLQVNEHAVTPVRWDDGYILGSSSYPHGMLTCNNCGHTLFYNLISLGILVPPKPPKQGGNDG